MSTKTFVYAAWCLLVAGGFLGATAFAWSPFAEGRRATAGQYRGGGYVGGVYVGPRHK